MSEPLLQLHVQTQMLDRDEGGATIWRTLTTTRVARPAATAIIVCDVWDQHWSHGAAERVAVLAPRIDTVLRSARERGVRIIHAPSETIAFYAESPARRRMLDLPDVEIPPLRDHRDPPLPIDDSDGGSDTGEVATDRGWTRQHAAIWIDEDRDGISDNGDEIYRFIRHEGIEQVLLLGVHANMCILRRSFAIKSLVRRDVPVALVRDLTDAMYNPARSPYVSHDEGTQLVIGYIEKFWCPTIHSEDL